MPVPTLSPRQQRAPDRGAPGTCATCPTTKPPSRTLPPGTYVLNFFEFKDHPTARDVRSRQRPLTPQAYQAVIGTSTVYLFRRQGGRTKPPIVLKGGGTYTLTVPAGEGGAEVYVFLSHCSLLQGRLDMYASEDGLEVLRQRAVRFTPDNSTAVRPAGGQTYDVVMPDWRRLAWDAHAREAKARDALMQFVDNPAKTRRRMLAELTCAVAVQYEKDDSKVWNWLRPAGQPGARAVRPKGMQGKPYRAPEAELAAYDRTLSNLQNQVERAASAKYAWMSEDGYRQMRWDTRADEAQQRETVKAEGALLTPASQSEAGKAYLKSYATRTDVWYGAYLLRPLPHEVKATKTDRGDAEAFWAILMSVGVAMLADDGRKPDRASANRDVLKNTLALPDAGEKEAWKDRQVETSEAQKDKFGRQRETRRTTAEYFEADRTATAARKEADATDLVVERVFLRAMEQHTGIEGFGVPWLVYDESKGRMVSLGTIVEAPVLTRRGAITPSLDVAAAQAARRAAAANERLAVAATSERASQRRFFDAEALEAKLGRGAAVTTGLVAALGVLNLAIALRDATKEPSAQNQIKAWGAVADLLYASEYGLLAYDRAQALKASTAAQAAEGGGVALRRVLFGVRLVGVVGAVLSFASGLMDLRKASRRGDVGQEVGAGVTMAGSFMLGLGMGAAMAEGTALAGWIAFAATTWWTGVTVIIALAGAAITWYFTNPPLKDWLQECPWGIDRKESKTDQQQLESLLQLLCAPRLTARVYRAGEYGAPTGAPGGVCFTLTPPFYFPGETKLSLRLDVSALQAGGIGTASASGAGIVAAPFPIASTSLGIDPAPEAVLARLNAGENVREVLKTTGRFPQDMGVVLRRQDGMVTFDVFLPMRRALDTSRSLLGGERLYSAGGSATVQLWTQSNDSWRRTIHLEEVPLADAWIEGLR